MRQEMWTLPQGPRETAPMWRDMARLGVNVWTAVVWGKNYPRRAQFTFLTRIMSKDACLTLALFEDLFKRLNLVGTQKLVMWSDTGMDFFRCPIKSY